MATTRRDGTTEHHWVTNKKLIDPVADKFAREFINNTNHLTPAVQAQLDNLLDALPTPESETDMVENSPDCRIMAQLNAPPESWRESWQDPTVEDLEAIAAEESKLTR